jgi:hypothetical protein
MSHPCCFGMASDSPQMATVQSASKTLLTSQSQTVSLKRATKLSGMRREASIWERCPANATK